MNFRLTAILVGSVLVLGVVLLIMSFLGDDSKTPKTGLMEELAALKPSDIDTVEMERADGSRLTMTKKSDHWEEEWEIQTPGGPQKVTASADQFAVEDLIKSLLNAQPTASPELTSNMAIHGLQPPSLKVTLKQGNERSSTINFGDVTIGGPKAVVFVTTSARPNRPLAVLRNSIEALFRTPGGNGKTVDLAKWAPDFRTKSLFGTDSRLALDEIEALTLSARGKTLSIARSAGNWKFVAPAGWGDLDLSGDTTAAPGTFTGARPLLGAITSLQASGPGDFIDNPTPDDLVKYGLVPANPDLIKVEARLKGKPVTTILIGKKDAPQIPTGPAMPPAGKVWVKVEGEPGVIKANAIDTAGLLAVIENPDPLRDHNLLAIADREKIDGLNITVGGQTTLLRRLGGAHEWKLYGNPSAGDPQPANDLAVRNILDVLLERRTIKSFPQPNPNNFAPAEIKAELKLWVDGFEASSDPKADPKAEPKEKGKPITLLFGKKEGDSLYVRRTLPDGSTTEFPIPDKIKLTAGGQVLDVIATVAKTRLELLDLNLKTFSSNLVEKISVSGLKNFDLEKNEKKDPSTNKDRWTFASPPDQKGKTADTKTVDDMLTTLGTQNSVSRVVDETPTPAKLIEYGLAPPAMPPPMPQPVPRLKVVVTLKGTDPADKERIYEFGVVTGDSVYARQAGKAAVFTLPKFVYDKFAEADLRDKEIFHFDAAQVNGLELKGWGNAGFQIVLNFEKKDGNWTAVAPPGFMADPRKIDKFLSTLSTTSVKSFLPGQPAPQQGAGNVKVTLEITLKMASGPPITITLGEPTSDNTAYFGWTSLLPKESPVFTVDSARFKEYKESSGAFAK